MKITRIQSLICFAMVLSGAMGTSRVSAQPSITGVFPDGTYQFQNSPALSFTANAAAGVTNISVQLTSTTLFGQAGFKTLTSGSGLVITGPSTSFAVSASLKSNLLYTAVIQVTDAEGATTSSTVSFDTINPSYTWEAEDWDYTDDAMISGLYIDNPQTNAYANLATTDSVDAHNSNGNSSYRPVGTGAQPGGLATETTGDKTRIQYIGTGKTDHNIGFTDGGDFGSYTRHYPPGTYNVFMRGSNGGGQAAQSAGIEVTAGTAFLSGAGFVSVPNIGGWQSYGWVPFKDNDGNAVTITFDDTPSTLRISTIDGSYNANFYLLLPTNAVVVGGPSDAAITNVFPNGSYQFQGMNQLSFEVRSTLGVNPSGITVQLNGTNLTGEGTSLLLSAGAGLSVSGPSTNRLVTASLASNSVYSVSIQVTDANDNGVISNLTFDTIMPAYTWEAEDWNHGGGQFFDNPQTNAYYGLDGAAGIDFNNPGDSHNAYLRIGFDEEGPVGDTPRLAYIDTLNEFGLPYVDYNVGFTSGGQWANYTRTFPAGIYNIYVRVARGDGGAVADAGSLSIVTSGYQTESQTLSQLGRYAVPSTGNWQKYVWAPVRDSGGNLVRFNANGSVTTLRVTMTGAGHNFNCFLLVPADLSQNPPPSVGDFKPDGSILFEPTNRLSFVANSSVGLPTNGIVVNVDGANVQGLTFEGSASSWLVTAPIQPNAGHTAIITLTDAVGTTRYTNSFGVFASTNFQWEAEDYDFDGGQHFDNQINAYAGLGGIADVDFHSTESGGTYVYRPAGTATESTSDLARDSFAGFTDYNIGFFEGGEWHNYTHAYPAGTYNLYGRIATGGGSPSVVYLSEVTSGVGTANQTTNVIGRFVTPSKGWGSYQWIRLETENGEPAVVGTTGSDKTFRLERPLDGSPGANINFLMLVAATPVAHPFTLTVLRSGTTVTVSFPTQSGFSYQLQYKNSLGDPSWLDLGGAVPGNGSVQSVNDAASLTSRYYRVHAH